MESVCFNNDDTSSNLHNHLKRWVHCASFAEKRNLQVGRTKFNPQFFVCTLQQVIWDLIAGKAVQVRFVTEPDLNLEDNHQTITEISDISKCLYCILRIRIIPWIPRVVWYFVHMLVCYTMCAHLRRSKILFDLSYRRMFNA